jgi:IclR family pca regulon transcriptional regulator
MPRTDHVQSLERGIAVLRSFDAANAEQTLSDVARRTSLTRATARRLLLTLKSLGYASSDGKHFSLTPAVLDIGYTYLSSLNVTQLAQPFLEALSEQVHESVSVSVLDGTDIIYIARVPTTRIMTISLGLGPRLPGLLSSMGGVQLSALPAEQVEAHLPVELEARTERSLTSRADLRAQLEAIRRQGWALVDQELELGVRSIAAPLRDSSGRAIAAMNISTHAGRTTVDELHSRFLPALLDTAAKINLALEKR